MSVPTCRFCKRPYWRYSGIFWPQGYCSIPCYQQRSRRKLLPGDSGNLVLADIRKHRKQVHGSVDLTEWYDCEMCEQLEARYAAAVSG